MVEKFLSSKETEKLEQMGFNAQNIERDIPTLDSVGQHLLLSMLSGDASLYHSLIQTRNYAGQRR